MGSTNSRYIKKHPGYKIDLSPPNNKICKIGLFLYQPNEIEEKYTKKFNKYISRRMSFSEILKKKQEKKSYNGIPQKYRWDCWKILLSIKKNDQEYISLPTANDYDVDIIKDLDRTFPNHPYLNKEVFGYYGQSALKRILRKFSSKYPEIGYCQGMNYIVSFLLMVSGGKEAEVFYVLEAFYEKYQLKEFFTKEMKGLKHYL